MLIMPEREVIEGIKFKTNLMRLFCKSKLMKGENKKSVVLLKH
jgi:hypothetical protein